MISNNYVIQVMQADQVQLAVQWAAAEGWNPGLHDAACFYRADPTGFLLGVLDGDPIATISAVKYQDIFGFIGFYMVKPEYRGQGYGFQLWQAAMATLQGRNVGLDGVLAQQDNYRQSGFQLAYRNIRYAGESGGSMPDDPRLTKLATLPFAEITAYDRQFFPCDRSQFLHGWLTQPDSHAWGVVRDHTLVGYGVIRACQTGYKIGPLFADTPEDSALLFQALRAMTPAAAPIYLDVPEVNPKAVSLAQQSGMQMVFETARMYTQECPTLPYERLYGVTSFELG